jgi:hypothetical protein
MKYTIIGWEPFVIEPRSEFETFNDALEEKLKLQREHPLHQYRIIPIELEDANE